MLRRRTTRLALLIALALTGSLGTVPVTAPSAHAEVRAAGCPGGSGLVKVVNQSARVRTSGVEADFYAELRNVTRDWRQVFGHVCVYDAAGALVAVHSNRIVTGTVGPRHRTLFYAHGAVPAGGQFTYRLSFKSRDTRNYYVTRIKPAFGQPWTDAQGALRIPLTVRNKNRFKVRKVLVAVALYDAEGKIQAVTWGRPAPAKLKRRKTGYYEATYGAEARGWRTAKAWVIAARAGR